MSATKNWSNYAPKDEVNRRAGGRRRLNAERYEQALVRRVQILELIGASWIMRPRGLQAKLALLFSVHRSTITRDIAAICEEWRHTHICRDCGAFYGCSLRVHTFLYKLQRRHDPTLQPSCCVRGYLAREARRKGKRVNALERQFRKGAER